MPIVGIAGQPLGAALAANPNAYHVDALPIPFDAPPDVLSQIIEGIVVAGQTVLFQADIAGTSTLSAKLVEGVSLKSAISGTSTLIAKLAETVSLKTAISGTATITADLTKGGVKLLQAAISGTSTLTAKLAETVSLKAGISGTSTLSSALREVFVLAKAGLSGLAALTANLTVSRPGGVAPLDDPNEPLNVLRRSQ